ncbi:MAG: DNA polymerase I, partial [Bacilli bacterium]|nr:DNA polymerase I [Bacilli bacterium]
DTIYQGYSFKSINEFCQKYGLKQFMNKLDSKWKISDDAHEIIDMEKVENFKNIELPTDLGLALDFDAPEDYYHSDIFGLAISTKEKSYYINIEDALKDEKLLNILKDEKYRKYAFDYKAIKVALRNLNVELNGLEFDILIASYLLDSSLKNSPEAVFHFYGVDLSEPKEEEMSLFTSENPTKTSEISHYSLALAAKAKAELVKISTLDLYNKLELPLIDTLANMEIEGFPLDINVLDEFGKEYKKKIEELSEEIYELAGERFNISSPKQIGEILYDKLGLPGNRKGSTSVDSLKEIIDKHPIVAKILEYRKYFKLVSTYIDGLKPHVNKDGKIHASFNQAQTQTGRLSSSNPNLQNISVRDEDGKKIRKAFFYPNHEYQILSLDYSQIELRILAHLSNCPGLKSVFESGEDIHSATAKRVFHLEGEPTSLQRRKAKAVNFGIIYGISDWGLSEQLEIPVYESREIINSFYEAFPEVAEFFKGVVDNALKDGYVSTMHGRRRYLRELHDSNYQTREFAKRAAMNAPIQGSAADLIKIAMIEVEKVLKENNLKTRMVLQIHDELIFKVPEEEKDLVYNLVKDKMTHALDLSVPLEVDGGFGDTWYDAK